MACILQPECYFLHGYFRCQLPVEVVDVEVKIMSMQGTHIFRRDRTTQLTKCTTWSSRLHPNPTTVKKMRTFLEVKGKLGPIPQPSSNQYRPPQPDTNPNVRKVNKATEKRRRIAPRKRFRANITAKSKNAATHSPATISKTSTPDNRPLPLEDAPVCKSTPWPGAVKILGNLFKERKDWLLPPNYLENNAKGSAGVTSTKPPIKEEPKAEEQTSINPKPEKCGWGPNCPFWKNRGRRRLEWWLPEAVAATATAPREGSGDPSKVPSDPKLPATPELSEIQPKDIWWPIPKPIRNLQAVGSRNGKT